MNNSHQYHGNDGDNQQHRHHGGFHRPQNQPSWSGHAPQQPHQHAGDTNRHRQFQPHQQIQHQNEQALPPGWIEATDPSSGKVYYCNPQTRETKWERPIALMTNASVLANATPQSGNRLQQHQHQQPLPPGWVEAKDPSSGKAYFCNPQTRETKWERPTSIVATPLQTQVEFQGNRNSHGVSMNSTRQDVHDNTGTNRSHCGLDQSVSSSTVATKKDANNDSDSDNADDSNFDELQSLTAGQIAHLIKLQRRQSEEDQQGDMPKDSNEIQNKPSRDSCKYTPIRLSFMSSLSATERAEPGRLDVRMYALREELKKFGYNQSSTQQPHLL